MRLRHIAALALLLGYWILTLNTGPRARSFYEWAGTFNSKEECEQALSREQTHLYDMNPLITEDDDGRYHHKIGKTPMWVHGRSGHCESSEHLFARPAPTK